MQRAPKRILTLSEMHRRTKISLAHLCKVYNGQRKLSADALHKVALAQGISMEQILAQIASEVKDKRKHRKAA